MSDLIPRPPRQRPLLWSDIVLELQDRLLELDLPPVYIVGGAVRDAYFHRPIKDLDLATPQHAIGLAKRLANHLHGDIFVMDTERDVARVFWQTDKERIVIDVAGFRGADLTADLRGRDFTVNAVAVDLRGDLTQWLDPLSAEDDLEQRVLRRCAPDALASDPIRGLRAVRQSMLFGLRIEPNTLQDIRQYAPELMMTSPERVRDEFMQLLALERAGGALRVADALGLLAPIFPDLVPLHNLAQPAPHMTDVWSHTLLTIEKLSQMLTAFSYRRTDATAAVFDLGMMVMQFDRYRRPLNEHIDTTYPNDRTHRALLILGALLHNVGKGSTADWSTQAIQSAKLAGDYAERLRLSNTEKKHLTTMIRQYRRIQDQTDWSPLAQHRFWHELGTMGHDVCLLGLADYLGTVGSTIDQDRWLQLVDRVRTLFAAYYDLHEQIVAPPSLLDGNDLQQQLGIPPSRTVGILLDLIREAQVTGEVQTVAEALDVARRYLATQQA